MKKVNKILVACDLSNYSIQAVEYAAEMADSVNAELVIVNVINQRDLDMIEKVTQHTDKITVSKYVSETKEYRSEEIAKVFAAAKRDPALYPRFRTQKRKRKYQNSKQRLKNANFGNKMILPSISIGPMLKRLFCLG